MTWSKHPHLESREWEEDRKPRLDQSSMEIQQGTHGTLQLSPCLVSRIHRDIIWAPLRLESLDSLSLPFAAHMVPLLGKLHLVTSAFLNLLSTWGFHCNLEFTLTASHQLTRERIRHLSSFHPKLLLLGFWRCSHSHHIDTELIAEPCSGWSVPRVVPHEQRFNLDFLLQLV